MLEILTSNALLPRHGFFTRKGGASSGIFAGLNCGPGSTDQSDVVQINRARVADAMGIAAEGLVSLNQVHSSKVVTLTEPPVGRVAADGMVTRVPGLGLGILTADCQPVLLADATAGVVGAAHAGWRGARDGVLEATVEAMVALGATRAGIAAVIGPTISVVAYEVGPEFFESFTADEDDHDLSTNHDDIDAHEKDIACDALENIEFIVKTTITMAGLVCGWDKRGRGEKLTSID